MLAKKVFIKGCVLIASTTNVELQSAYTDAVYGIIKNDFTDADFMEAVVQILRNEDLYGRMPTVKTFLDYAVNKEPTQLEIENFGKTMFLRKVSAYLAKKYVSLEEKESFNNSLTDIEYNALLTFGGISELWRRVHDEDYPANTGKIIKELADFYNDNVTAGNVSSRILSHEDRGGEMKQLADLIRMPKLIN